MNIHNSFPSKYLKAAVIPKDRRIIATIDNVVVERIQRDTRPVVYFQGKDKGLVLNQTNAKKISEIAGTDETDNWRGLQIALFVVDVEFQGKWGPAIRVDYPQNGLSRPSQPQAVSPRFTNRPEPGWMEQPPPHTDADRPAQQDDDDIPF